MAFKHRLDPAVQWDQAPRLAKLIAQGVLSIDDAIPALVNDAMRAGYSGDTMGLRTRLFWHCREAVEQWRVAIEECKAEITQALRPYLDRFSSAPEMIAAAYAMNTAAGEPMLQSDVLALVAERAAERVAVLNARSSIKPARMQPRGARRYGR